MEDTDFSKGILDELELAQARAKADSKGIWSGSNGSIDTSYEVADVKTFADENKGKKLNGIVERVLTGDRLILRLLLSSTKHVQTVAVVAGIRAPSTRRTNPSDGKEQPAEPFGEEAQAYMESRVLQRTLNIEVVGTTPQGLLVCSVAHQQGGDMASHLLRNGLARCVDHHSTMLGAGMSALRTAEREAKTKKLAIFKDHVAPKAASESEVTVVRVQTADTVFVRNRAGAEKKLNLSSVRQPKPTDPAQAPFQAEAKEYMRKKLIGKHVKIAINGKKPASEGYEEREVATVTQGGKNVALGLIEAGYGSVIRHKRDDTDRSPIYDELLAAEEIAAKEKKGMWSGKPQGVKQYVDYSESLQKAKIQASVLQRQKRIPAIVDFVKGPSRFTILIPRENAKLTLVLSCLRAPRSARNTNEKSEPFGQEAHDFANRKCQQRDVEVDIEGTDKVGGFIGTLYVNRENFSKLLLEEGFASVHAYSAEQSPNGAELFAAEKKAKDSRSGIWKDYDPAEEEGEDVKANTAGATDQANGDTVQTRKLDYKEVAITYIDPATLRLKVQLIGTGTGALEELMNKFRSFQVSNSSSLPGDPKTGEYVSAKFSEDGLWYRARIRRNDREKKEAEVVYIDYGNEEKLPWKSLRPLPSQYDAKTLRAQAVDAQLSFMQFPTSSEYLRDAVDYLYQTIGEKTVIANVDATDKDGTMYLTLFEKNIDVKETESINALVVAEGLAMVPTKLRPWEKSAPKLLDDLKERQAVAKEARRGMWEYGDITDD